MMTGKDYVLPKNVRENEDGDFVAKLRAVLGKNGGYCPCRLQKIPDNVCVCKEFRDQIEDKNFSGYCHCRLYFKEKE